MPQTKQAAKALRQNRIKAAKNKIIHRSLKTRIKKSKKAIETKKENIVELLRDTFKRLDKAAEKGLIKKATAGRKKSRLQKLLNRTQKLEEKK